MKDTKKNNNIVKNVKLILVGVESIKDCEIKDVSKEKLKMNIDKAKEILEKAMYKCCQACNKSSDMWKEYYFSMREEALAEFNSISNEDKEKIVDNEFKKAKNKVKKDKLDNEKYMKTVYDNTRKRTLKKMLTDIEKRIVSERWEKDGKEFKNVVQGTTKLIMKDYNTSNVGCLDQQLVQANWNRDKEKILSYEARVPQYKKDTPYYFYNNSYAIEKRKNGYYVSLSLFSKEGFETNNIKVGTRLVFKVDKLDGNKMSTLNKIIEGDYKQGSSHISISSKGKIELIVSFSFENNKLITLNKYRILGVDLGIINVATLSIYDGEVKKYDWVSYKRNVMSGGELISFRQKCFSNGMKNSDIEEAINSYNSRMLQKQFYKLKLGYIDGFEVANMRINLEKRKIELQIASKWCGKGRCGHGKKTKVKPIEKQGDKIARFRDTYNHKVSRYIVEFAVKNNCGIIQMEDLSGITKDVSNKFLKDWSYYDLQNKIIYKAKEYGIEVIKVNPEYTSKRCNKCGCIHKENREGSKSQSKFECVICGHKENADVNASKNIAFPNIAKIIEETPKQGYNKEGKVS